jgi:hypothetical protein
MNAHRLHVLAVPCAALAALSLAACAQTVSTSHFKGEQREVAQAIANLQSDVTAADQQKICAQDLASAVVARLNTASGGCKQVIKNQLTEVDNLEVKVGSVLLSTGGSTRSASATVASIYAGKTRTGTVFLLKENGKWKISGLR